MQAQNIFKAEYSVKASTYSFPGSNHSRVYSPDLAEDELRPALGTFFNPKQTKPCLYGYCWQAPSLGNEGMWYLSRGNNKAPCLDTRTMSAPEVPMIKARVWASWKKWSPRQSSHKPVLSTTSPPSAHMAAMWGGHGQPGPAFLAGGACSSWA